MIPLDKRISFVSKWVDLKINGAGIFLDFLNDILMISYLEISPDVKIDIHEIYFLAILFIV